MALHNRVIFRGVKPPPSANSSLKPPWPKPGKDRTKIARSCSPASGAARQFSISSLQQTAGLPVAEDAGAAASEASEWDIREREKRLAALREEGERLGMEE